MDPNVPRGTALSSASDTQEAIDIAHEVLQDGPHSTRSQAAHLPRTPDPDHYPPPLPLSKSDTHTPTQQLQPPETAPESRTHTPSQQLQPRETSPNPRIMDWVNIQLEDVGSMVEQFFSWLWWIFKWPILTILVVLLSLQLIALGYTVLSQAYLNHFCIKNLPFIRDWICSEVRHISSSPPPSTLQMPTYGKTDSKRCQWDQRQNRGIDVNASFTEPVVLMHGTNIPWDLPLSMTMWETSFRDIRVNIAGSELQERDKVFFREQANRYLELSPVAIENLQVFFNHILGTARRTVAYTDTMLLGLEDSNVTLSFYPEISTGYMNNLLSGPVDSSDDVLTTGMGWLASHRLIYLPVGVEPFREARVYDSQLYAISLMEEHTNKIDRRLLEELAMVTDLTFRLGELADIADEARERSIERFSAEQRAKIARGDRDQSWQWVVDKIWGTSMDQYLSKQRLIFLKSMGPIYRNASEYLVFKTKGLHSIRNACQIVQERLREERSNLKPGRNVSGWLMKRYRVLKEGKEILEKELKGWTVEKTRTEPRQT